MTSKEIAHVIDVFDLNPRELARVLNVAPQTITRWLSDAGCVPTGLAADVLRGLHGAALQVQHDEARRREISGLLTFGVGAMIFHLLTVFAATSRGGSRAGA